MLNCSFVLSLHFKAFTSILAIIWHSQEDVDEHLLAAVPSSRAVISVALCLCALYYCTKSPFSTKGRVRWKHESNSNPSNDPEHQKASNATLRRLCGKSVVLVSYCHLAHLPFFPYRSYRHTVLASYWIWSIRVALWVQGVFMSFFSLARVLSSVGDAPGRVPLRHCWIKGQRSHADWSIRMSAEH